MFPENPAALMKRMDGHPVRVLVGDDEPSLAEQMANVLRYEGWEAGPARARPVTAKSPRCA